MKITDLSMMLEEGMQTFAAHWHPFFESTQLGRHGIENRETRKIILGTHTGTHIDAPRHFIARGETIENVPLEQINGPALVVDFSALPDKHEISREELCDALNNRCPERLIARFDWDLKLNTNEYYTDHAFFSEEACQWLVDNGCRVIALDTPQPDNPLNGRGAEKDAPNHKILLGAGTVIVEYLVDIRKLSQQEVTLIVAPLKIKGGDGAPVRCFVIEEM
ncbi:cyclase family protein [Enterovibrio paralichthyis]|uniref:cyclase family protein n=1 Tax=Enterovibrio paralichthyis TaxID=2853805 RepID=UPI001C4787B5|nr:cyclase family protein [Enterovibrio paralichthyis]MBV7298629.1 cyclase family protein [Enterovibrio paralichthyis]